MNTYVAFIVTVLLCYSSWTDMDSQITTTSTVTTSDNVTQSSDDYFNFILYEVTVPLLYGVVTVLGIIGNSLVIYVIASKERMRTVTNFLLLNLAVADLSFVVVIPPSTAYVFAANAWPFGDIACRLMHYLINVTAYVTVYTLVPPLHARTIYTLVPRLHARTQSTRSSSSRSFAT